jgi:hypothetical protein
MKEYFDGRLYQMMSSSTVRELDVHIKEINGKWTELQTSMLIGSGLIFPFTGSVLVCGHEQLLL